MLIAEDTQRKKRRQASGADAAVVAAAALELEDKRKSTIAAARLRTPPPQATEDDEDEGSDDTDGEDDIEVAGNMDAELSSSDEWRENNRTRRLLGTEEDDAILDIIQNDREAARQRNRKGKGKGVESEVAGGVVFWTKIRKLSTVCDFFCLPYMCLRRSILLSACHQTTKVVDTD